MHQDDQTLLQLEALFSAAPPQHLRKSLNKVLFRYLMCDENLYPDQKEVITDFYLLMEFLEKVEEEQKN